MDKAFFLAWIDEKVKGLDVIPGMRVKNGVHYANELSPATKASREFSVEDEVSTIKPRVLEPFGQNAELRGGFDWQEGDDMAKNILRDMIKGWMVGIVWSNISWIPSRVWMRRVSPPTSLILR